jgi:pyruvate kinase
MTEYIHNFFPIKTKIVCTIGPASSSYNTLEQMAKAGMNIARLNFSHGLHSEHKRSIDYIREISTKIRKPISILQDLPGSKIRIGKLKETSINLERDSIFVFTTRKIDGTDTIVSVNHEDFPKMVNSGDALFLGDGSVKLEVLDVGEYEVKCRVLIGGELVSGKGLNIKSSSITNFGNSITKQDKEHIAFGLKQDVDFMAFSFIRSANDILEARRIIQDYGGNCHIIAKIEKKEAVDNIDDIIKKADGIMIARGDLGVEIGLEKIPIVQKSIIEKCNSKGKPVITATQMLESMVNNPSPTRAEITDISNAIIDGTDCIMLSEETAIGKYPVETIEFMVRIANTTEEYLPYAEILNTRRKSIKKETNDVISYLACYAALELDAVAIVTPTRSGATARRISRYRPPLPIIVLTPNSKVLNEINLHWGTNPFLTEKVDSMDALMKEIGKIISQNHFFNEGEAIVMVAGDPNSPSGTTNLLEVQTVGVGELKSMAWK